MDLNNIRPLHAGKDEKRVGRGGKRGTTAGRGTKGQKARSGHCIRPAERDLIQRLPKLRGYKNKPKYGAMKRRAKKAIAEVMENVEK
jgi:large subunit ribosomal protein L15